MGEETGIGRSKVAKESVDGGQPDVTGSRSILSSAPEMFEELPDKLGAEVVHREIGALFSALLNGKL
jgi:hypothetical protein